jgi:hypothetical protein
MTDLKKAAQQALKALEATHYDVGSAEKQRLQVMDAITTLRAALAQQEQEPVAWRYRNANTDHVYLVWKKGTGGRNWTPLYTHPPRREWQSLSEDELTALGVIHSRYQEESLETGGWFDFARAVEAALKEKNNG